MNQPPKPQHCAHKMNPTSCPFCYHQRAQQPAPHAPGQKRYTATGEEAFDAPVQIQKGVTRALNGFVSSMPDASQAPQGEQAVEPSEATSGKVSVVDGQGSQASQKQRAAPNSEPSQMKPEFRAPRPEPNDHDDLRLWEPDAQATRADGQGQLIDKLPRHPEAVPRVVRR